VIVGFENNFIVTESGAERLTFDRRWSADDIVDDARARRA
jgi:hypothetical protein